MKVIKKIASILINDSSFAYVFQRKIKNALSKKKFKNDLEIRDIL